MIQVAPNGQPRRALTLTALTAELGLDPDTDARNVDHILRRAGIKPDGRLSNVRFWWSDRLELIRRTLLKAARGYRSTLDPVKLAQAKTY
jgi:hypothetical protein